MTDKVVIYLPWYKITPDPRQFKPSAPSFGLTPVPDYESTYEERCPLFVALEIPLTEELIYNCATIAKAREWKFECASCGQGANRIPKDAVCPVCSQEGFNQLVNEPYPILTKYGVSYVVNEMESALKDKGSNDASFPNWDDDEKTVDPADVEWDE